MSKFAFVWPSGDVLYSTMAWDTQEQAIAEFCKGFERKGYSSAARYWKKHSDEGLRCIRQENPTRDRDTADEDR